jgi:hypothetical protein
MFILPPGFRTGMGAINTIKSCPVSSTSVFTTASITNYANVVIATAGLVEIDLTAIPLNSYVMFNDVMWYAD